MCLAIVLVTLPCVRSADLELELRSDWRGWKGTERIELVFKNTGDSPIVFKLAPEGSCYCEDFFELECELVKGRPNKICMYAPTVPTYSVILAPGGFYRHLIQPDAHKGGAELRAVKRIRVKYSDRSSGRRIESDWLEVRPPPKQR